MGFSHVGGKGEVARSNTMKNTLPFFSHDNNAESYDALVKRGLICEIMRCVMQAYDFV